MSSCCGIVWTTLDPGRRSVSLQRPMRQTSAATRMTNPTPTSGPRRGSRALAGATWLGASPVAAHEARRDRLAAIVVDTLDGPGSTTDVGWPGVAPMTTTTEKRATAEASVRLSIEPGPGVADQLGPDSPSPRRCAHAASALAARNARSEPLRSTVT